MPSIDEIEIADEPARWAALGFELGRTGSAGSAAVDVRLSRRGSEGESGRCDRRLVAAGYRRAPSSTACRPTISERRPSAPRSPHPNGVVAIDHVVAVLPELRAHASAALAGRRASTCRRIREEPTPAGAPRQAFFRLGGEILELVPEPDEASPPAAARSGPCLPLGLALLVDDVDAAVAADRAARAPRGPRCSGAGSRRSSARPGSASRFALIARSRCSGGSSRPTSRRQRPRASTSSPAC